MFIIWSVKLAFLFFQSEKSIFLPSHTLYHTVEMCIKYKVYGLSDIYVKQYFYLLFNWIKIVCMYNVTAVPDLFSPFMGVRMTLLSATRPLRLLNCQRFSEGINQSRCQKMHGKR